MDSYLTALQLKIEASEGCKAVHAKTVPVTERFQGGVAWDGVVEVFDLTGHPKAKHAYAWGHPSDKGPGLSITLVLEIPPVTSPETAVKAALVAAAKAQRN